MVKASFQELIHFVFTIFPVSFCHISIYPIQKKKKKKKNDMFITFSQQTVSDRLFIGYYW